MAHRSASLQSGPRVRRPHAAPSGAAPPDDRIAAIARAVGHPARIRILRFLLQNRSCIGCDIVDEVGLAQSTVSEHLRILKAAGVVTGDTDHPRICYSLRPASLAPLVDLLNSVFQERHSGERSAPTCCALDTETEAAR